MGAGIDGAADFLEMGLHGLGIGIGHDQTGGLALGRADGAEDPSPLRTLVLRCARAGAALCPAPGELVLLSNARFVLPPDLYLGAGRQARLYGFDPGREVFLNASSSASSCSGCCGRAVRRA